MAALLTARYHTVRISLSFKLAYTANKSIRRNRLHLVPFYTVLVLVGISSLLKSRGRIWVVIYIMALVISLMPTPLLEPRYFTPGVVIAVLNTRISKVYYKVFKNLSNFSALSLDILITLSHYRMRTLATGLLQQWLFYRFCLYSIPF